ncbi:MAG: hypothetical protein V7721_12545 [Porticoccaceae bacterium]
MLNNYPKQRSPLPDTYQKIYHQHYKENRDGDSSASSLASKLERWMHRQVAGDADQMNPTTETLEIGAGTLNQLEHEVNIGNYDIVEPYTELYEQSSLTNRLRNTYADISQLPGSQHYDRITSIAAFEHICNLPEVIATCGLHLKARGHLRIAIPSEGTLLWTLGWKLTTGIEFRLRHGLDYGLLMSHEHVNTAREIDDLLHYFFCDVKIKSFGVCRSLSFYQFFVCADPNLSRCEDYLASIKSDIS